MNSRNAPEVQYLDYAVSAIVEYLTVKNTGQETSETERVVCIETECDEVTSHSIRSRAEFSNRLHSCAMFNFLDSHYGILRNPPLLSSL